MGSDMKHYYFYVVFCLTFSHTIFGMRQVPQAKETMSGRQFAKYQVELPLRLGQNPPRIQKDVFLFIPTELVVAQRACKDEKDAAKKPLALYEREAIPEMNAVIDVCTELMFVNDQEWFWPEFEEDLQFVNPELLALVQNKQTYFVYSREQKTLLLRWDLGEYENGWAFDKVIEIQYIPDHNRHGTCSLFNVLYRHHRDNIHGKVPLTTLRSEYAAAGKQTKLNPLSMALFKQIKSSENIERMQKEDVVAMAMHYVSNLKNAESDMSHSRTK